MGSKSAAQTATNSATTSTALERDNVMGNGQMISDSIIIDPSDEVMKSLVASFNQQYQTLVAGSSASTQTFADLAKEVLKSVDSGQVKMTDFAYNTLKEGYSFLQQQLAAGKYTIDFAGRAVDQSYQLAGSVVDSNSSTVDRALGLLGDVKTGDFSASLKSITSMVMIFALGAIYLTLKGKK